MKKVMIIAILGVLAGSVSSVRAEDWEIRHRYGNQYELRPKYNYDYDLRYRGTIDSSGTMNFRNSSSGDRLRGSLDSYGYGTLRSSFSSDPVSRIRP